MNRKEDFIVQITNETKLGNLKWVKTSGSNLQDLSLNAHKIVLAFEANYKGAILYYIVKKLPEIHSELEEYFETPYRSLVAVEGGLVALEIDDDEVAEHLIDQLFSLIRSKSEKGFLDKMLGES